MKIPGLLISGIVLWTSAAAPLAQVRTQVRNTSIDQNESLRVRYETDSAAGWPDLSPLEQDFIIQGRNSGRSVRTINGQTSQRTTLTLTLRPKRSGELTLPAIDFGTESSEAISIQVSSTGLDLEPVYSPPTPPTGHDGFPMPAPTPWIPTPAWSVPAGDVSEVEVTPVPIPLQQPGPQAQIGSQTNYWPWLTGFALLGWALTGLWTWRRKTPDPNPPATQPMIQTAPPREDPAVALPAIEQAYRRKDAYAAKKALLHWAALRWPEDPPGNLGRLAARCPGNVQAQIMHLEEALYNPGSDNWNQRAIWEQLPMEDKGPKSAAA